MDNPASVARTMPCRGNAASFPRNAPGFSRYQDALGAFNDAAVYPEKVRLNREYLETGDFGRDLGYVLATVWPGLARRLGLDKRLGLRFAEFSARMEREAVRY